MDSWASSNFKSTRKSRSSEALNTMRAATNASSLGRNSTSSQSSLDSGFSSQASGRKVFQSPNLSRKTRVRSEEREVEERNTCLDPSNVLKILDKLETGDFNKKKGLEQFLNEKGKFVPNQTYNFPAPADSVVRAGVEDDSTDKEKDAGVRSDYNSVCEDLNKLLPQVPKIFDKLCQDRYDSFVEANFPSSLLDKAIDRVKRLNDALELVHKKRDDIVDNFKNSQGPNDIVVPLSLHSRSSVTQMTEDLTSISKNLKPLLSQTESDAEPNEQSLLKDFVKNVDTLNTTLKSEQEEFDEVLELIEKIKKLQA